LTQEWAQLDGPIRSMMNSKPPTSEDIGTQRKTGQQMGKETNQRTMNE